MKKCIKITLGASETSNTRYIDFDDFDLLEEDWEAMSDEQKKEIIQECVNKLNDQPFWVLETFETE